VFLIALLYRVTFPVPFKRILGVLRPFNPRKMASNALLCPDRNQLQYEGLLVLQERPCITQTMRYQTYPSLSSGEDSLARPNSLNLGHGDSVTSQISFSPQITTLRRYELVRRVYVGVHQGIHLLISNSQVGRLLHRRTVQNNGNDTTSFHLQCWSAFTTGERNDALSRDHVFC
jgi:hypothetical protein